MNTLYILFRFDFYYTGALCRPIFCSFDETEARKRLTTYKAQEDEQTDKWLNEVSYGLWAVPMDTELSISKDHNV